MERGLASVKRTGERISHGKFVVEEELEVSL
jgi:hypothetical protein